MASISLVCRAAEQPHGRGRTPCTGCSCACHDVIRPANFRALVEARKAEVAREEAED